MSYILLLLLLLLSQQNTLDAYPCGSDHTPSPMASRVLVEAEPIFDSPSVRLTAVAVSVREEHTIAFLGDSQGNLHKVLKEFFFVIRCFVILFHTGRPLICCLINNHLRESILEHV